MFPLISGSVMHPSIVYTLIDVMITGTVIYIYALTISGLGPKLHGTMRKRHARAANMATQCNIHWHGHCMHALESCHMLLLMHIQS